MNTKQRARLGGVAIREKYGMEYLRELGRRGALAYWKKYRLVPVGISEWHIVNRETGEVVGTRRG